MSKLIDRIQKLLELSKSDNEHEAALAAANAAKLMVDHQITEAELVVEVEAPIKVDQHVVDTTGRVVEWRLSLVKGLAESAGCTWFTGHGGRLKNASRWQHERTYNIVGSEDDVNTIKYMYAFLGKEVERLSDKGWAAIKAEGFSHLVSGRKWKNSFRRGAADKICTRLIEMRATTMEDLRDSSPGANALIVLDKRDDAIKAYHDTLNLRNRPRGGVSDADAYFDGVRAGKTVNLNAGPALGVGTAQIDA